MERETNEPFETTLKTNSKMLTIFDLIKRYLSKEFDYNLFSNFVNKRIRKADLTPTDIVENLKLNHTVDEINTLQQLGEIKKADLINNYAEQLANAIPFVFATGGLLVNSFKRNLPSEYEALKNKKVAVIIIKENLNQTIEYYTTHNNEATKAVTFISQLIKMIRATAKVESKINDLKLLAELSKIWQIKPTSTDTVPLKENKEITTADKWKQIPRINIEDYLKQLVANGYINNADFEKLINNIFGADVELENKIETPSNKKSHITTLFHKMYSKATGIYIVNQLEWYNLLFKNFTNYKQAKDIKEANNMFKPNSKVIWDDFKL